MFYIKFFLKIKVVYEKKKGYLFVIKFILIRYSIDLLKVMGIFFKMMFRLNDKFFFYMINGKKGVWMLSLVFLFYVFFITFLEKFGIFECLL